MATVDQTFTVDTPSAVVYTYLTDRETATVWRASRGSRPALAQTHRCTREPRSTRSGVPRPQGWRVHCRGHRVRAGSGVRTSRALVPRRGSFATRSRKKCGSTRVDFHIEGETGDFFRLAEPTCRSNCPEAAGERLFNAQGLVEPPIASPPASCGGSVRILGTTQRRESQAGSRCKSVRSARPLYPCTRCIYAPLRARPPPLFGWDPSH